MDPVDSSEASAVSSVLPAAASNLLSHDVKDLQTVSKYVAKKEDHLQKVSKDVSKMGKLKSIWNSKVPEKNKTFYNFVSLTPSNRDEILAEIKKYQDFYAKLSSVVRQVNENSKDKEVMKSSSDEEFTIASEKEDEKADTGDETSTVKRRIQMFEKGIHKVAEKDSVIGNGSCAVKADDENLNYYLILLDMNEHLAEMTKAAKLGKKNTGNSTLYNLHKEFIAKHDKLESMIKKVECVALKDDLRKATDGFKGAICAVRGLQNDLKQSEAKLERMVDRCDWLATQNELLMNKTRILQESLEEVCAKVKRQ